jgi:hypothetical protein
MNVDNTRLLDCAHVDQVAGICQYEGCAHQICSQCTATCTTCNIVLCPGHQVQPAGQDPVFCRAHVSRYVAKRLVTTLADKL